MAQVVLQIGSENYIIIAFKFNDEKPMKIGRIYGYQLQISRDTDIQYAVKQIILASVNFSMGLLAQLNHLEPFDK